MELKNKKGRRGSLKQQERTRHPCGTSRWPNAGKEAKAIAWVALTTPVLQTLTYLLRVHLGSREEATLRITPACYRLIVTVRFYADNSRYMQRVVLFLEFGRALRAFVILGLPAESMVACDKSDAKELTAYKMAGSLLELRIDAVHTSDKESAIFPWSTSRSYVVAITGTRILISYH
ncbi:unnamed protein product [Xylocopa violacea]|uniref:Uncharacterized protein n=1 Tax=Xylocopa violacea TaxID=135666 RepID=A0ABP1PBP6_XYLVO